LYIQQHLQLGYGEKLKDVLLVLGFDRKCLLSIIFRFLIRNAK
jgi:hypothetical protein